MFQSLWKKRKRKRKFVCL